MLTYYLNTVKMPRSRFLRINAAIIRCIITGDVSEALTVVAQDVDKDDNAVESTVLGFLLHLKETQGGESFEYRGSDLYAKYRAYCDKNELDSAGSLSFFRSLQFFAGMPVKRSDANYYRIAAE